MIHRAPSSCFGAVSSIQYGSAQRLLTQRVWRPYIRVNTYATAPSQPPKDSERPENSALFAVQRRSSADRINPARSTLPAPLDLPTQGSDNKLVYLFRIGRAYGSFYWVGIKAVWFNYQAVRLLKQEIEGRGKPGQGGEKSSKEQELKNFSRAEYQLMQRSRHDIGKLPFFGVLVALFGEWLPLLVPFIPGAVPMTCRIPKQVEQMRAKTEERRRLSFRQGISEPAMEDMPTISAAVQETGTSQKAPEWPMTQVGCAATLISRLRDDQLHHLSSTLDLHSRLWDRIQQQPPSFLLRRGISKRLAYLTSDDRLLGHDGGVRKLSWDELMIACQERGLDVLGKREEVLRQDLSWWIDRQVEDKGRGRVMLTMLFRRLAIRHWVYLNVKANRRI